ncbi:MAG: hypothetical protein HQL22_08370 [Candidatus Omnitrophica bacterium]|nr:hypothetical protein [Candidatus Omnitrophota bacterium]
MFMSIKGMVFKIAATLAICAASLGYFSVFVPINMDEFNQYHGIICHEYQGNMFNSFRESCSDYDLAIIPGYFLPLRTFAYVGNVHSLLYYPLFKLWPAPSSARLLGIIMLFIQAILIWKIFRIDVLIVFFLLMSFMPYAFQHLVDTGPVSFQTTSIFLICYLSRKWAASLAFVKGWSWRYACALGVVLFVGVWVKLVYIILFPAIFILIGYFLAVNQGVWRDPKRLRMMLRDIGILLIISGVLIFLLLNAHERSGDRYYHEFLAAHSIPFSDHAVMGRHLCTLIKYFTNPLWSAHRIFIIDKEVTMTGLGLIALVVSFLIFSVWQLRAQRIKIGFVVLNLALFTMTFLLMVKNQRVESMHHVVLMYPFLLLALFYVMARVSAGKFMYFAAAVFICINSFLYFSLTRMAVSEITHPSLVRLNDYLNKNYSHDSIFVNVSWGMYYLKALYGEKDQCVLYMEPFDRRYMLALDPILGRTHRRALFIGRVNALSESFFEQHYKELKLDFDTGTWRVWY